MPRGRERILDEGKQREVCALLSAGCSLQAAARYVDCVPNTVRREAARNPDFRRRFRRARLKAQLTPLQAMQQASATHWRAAAWMLERGDPEQFARRPAPAFRPKQAKALKKDILAILSAEIEDPQLLVRVRKQIRHLIDYSIDGVVSVERTNRSFRSTLRAIDELLREDEARASAARSRALASRTPSVNGKPAIGPLVDNSEPSTKGQPTTDPPHLPPTRFQPPNNLQLINPGPPTS